MRKAHLLFWAAILFACSLMAGCAQDMSKYSAEYRAVHEKTFWAELSGGGADGGAQAWANLKAHQEAERVAGK